jgi:hypothetical protein
MRSYGEGWEARTLRRPTQRDYEGQATSATFMSYFSFESSIAKVPVRMFIAACLCCLE